MIRRPFRIADGDDLRPGPLKEDGGEAPTLPAPWTATLAPSIGMARWRAASEAVTNTPFAVASKRPTEPPRAIGLPVTTPGTTYPFRML